MPAYRYPSPPVFYGGYAPYGYPPAQRAAPVSVPSRPGASAPARAGAGASSEVGPQGSRKPETENLSAPVPDAFRIEETRLGRVLTSDLGLTLYRSIRDSDGVSECAGNCGPLWRPFLMAQSEQPAPPFGAVPHPDGSRQWSHEGHPLYLWLGDEQAGDVTGDGVDGIWQAVRVSAQDALSGSALGSDRESRQ
ncbi:putative lipoprotein [Imhoffiella purpurea]|uniref:Putative lipoprotein n=2 Tax=Imhoffiella purpurea TaxID=1249627 RepID=W9VWB5_9GAMM|nr:putative lipoprotein [Imhoffiella purpurea]